MGLEFRVRVVDQFPKLATRPEGIGAREWVLQRLQENEHLEIDFSGAVMTPSFAEEFIGKLASRLGEKEFFRRVKLSNTTNKAKSLLEFVIDQQIGKGVPAA
jgi:hypothetical protein